MNGNKLITSKANPTKGLNQKLRGIFCFVVDFKEKSNVDGPKTSGFVLLFSIWSLQKKKKGKTYQENMKTP